METPHPLQPIRAEDFTYSLPEDCIAQFPLAERDASKLLVYGPGGIQHAIFRELGQHLPPASTLFFNNTRVIPARLYFHKGQEGALIEVFLLHPVSPHHEVSLAMQATRACTWACTVGNLKRFKDHTVLERELVTEQGHPFHLRATLANRATQWVNFEWDADLSFAELLTYAGVVPLPPYLHREAEERDKTAYQTVYAQNAGAVAAPTAGLHFTPELLGQLAAQGIGTDYLTLHVAGGTFQPIRHENVLEHPMHAEQMIVTAANVRRLLAAEQVVAVGTTSMRTLESLYWFGSQLLADPNAEFRIGKLVAYEPGRPQPSRQAALEQVLAYLERRQLAQLVGETEIMIIPGYDFRVCDALITNFHLPGTTLIMLVAAFIGPAWREVYQAALDHQYRFLSFGDSSLLFRSPKPAGQVAWPQAS
jgi:S-adenosylmethionine:tRNA ribosyltransferase-isomerase